MMKRLLLALGFVALLSSAHAQSVQQSGVVTPNTSPIWNGTGIIKGGNTATDSPLTTFGVTRDAADALCVSSARATAAGRNTLCLQAATSGPAKISLQNYGTATAQDLQFILNGTTLTLPSGGGTFVTGTGAFVAGHAACWNSTTGILQDCGVSVASGTQFGIPYYSTSSTLTSTGAATSGQILLGQNAAAPLWTNLSGDVSAVSAGGAVTLSKVNGIPFSSTYTAHGVLLGEASSAFTSLATASVGQCLLSQGSSADPIWSSCAAGAGSAGGSNTQVQFNNTTSLGGSANFTWVSPALTLGVAGTTTGQLALAPAAGASGTVTVQNPSATSAYNFNLPTGAGSLGQPMLSGGGGSTAMTFGTLGVAGGGTGAASASGTALDNITGFASTGFIQRTGAGTYAFSTVVTVSGGGTGLASGTSGGIPAYTGASTMTSSALLSQYSLIAGGGAGAVPATVTKGTAGQILIDQTAANPVWSTMSGDATINSAGALTIANSAVTVGKMANGAAYTLMGNFTGGAAAPQFSTMGNLTQKASPAAGDYLILQDNSASGQIKYATVSSVSSAGSVASIAGNTGSFTLAGGVSNSTNQIQFDGNYGGWALQNCGLDATVAASVLTITLKDHAGSTPSATSPCYINYRNATTSTGTTTLVAQTGALSIDTNAIGASLGAPSTSTPFRFWIVAINNGGTNVLALINCTGQSQIFALNEAAPISSTAMSATATTAGVFYTPNGTTVSSKAFRILGYIEYGTGLVTAGTYPTGPTIMQMFGDGIKKPGETVQRVYTSTTTQLVTASPSYLATNLAQNFTKASAANPVRLDVGGSYISNGASAQSAIRLYRGNAACTTAIGTGDFNGPVAINGLAGQSLHWIDAPAGSGTTAAQYTVCASAANSVSISWPYSGAGATMILEEIMG